MEFLNEKKGNEGMSTQSSSMTSVQNDPSTSGVQRWYVPGEDVVVVDAGHPYSWHRRHQKYCQRAFVIFSVIVFSILVLGGYWVPLLTAHATITLRLKQTTVRISPTLSLAFSPSPTLNGQHIRVRVLPSLLLSQALVVYASGHDYMQSSPAHGFITFHNQSSVFRVIPAHTPLVTSHGMRVVTDQEADLPAAASSSLHGWSTVQAHVSTPRWAGGIPPYALEGTCCAPGVSFLNYWSFTGGTAPIVSSVLTQSDVDQSVASIRPTLDTSLHAALAVQTHHDEMLLSPATCTVSYLLSHPVGSRVSSATVLVHDMCPHAEAANTQDVQTVMSKLLIQEAKHTLGDQYDRVSEIHVEAGAWRAIPTGTSDTVSLPVEAAATWQYDEQKGEGQKMIQVLAGKRKDEAERQLRSTDGIQDVSIEISGLEQDTLPLFSGNIHLTIQTVKQRIKRGSSFGSRMCFLSSI